MIVVFKSFLKYFIFFTTLYSITPNKTFCEDYGDFIASVNDEFKGKNKKQKVVGKMDDGTDFNFTGTLIANYETFAKGRYKQNDFIDAYYFKTKAMKIITSEELKAIQLDLLQKTADFCKENGIRYYLCGGTLLGAIRHKGYIPWDDDIDISMPRPDYDRFISMFNKPENDYQVIDMSNNKKYGLPFAKVHDTRTFVDELQYTKDQFGVYIDIFPIDGVGEDEQVLRILRWRNI